MAFDWKEYLELAKTLRGQPGSGFSAEASIRTAVSRSYYAAFCWARNYAASQLGFQRTGVVKDHKKLREHLRQSGKLQVASRLNRLRQWRNQCDYDDQVPNLNYLVMDAIQQAEKVIQECR